MKYYSTELQQTFDTEKECLAAEREYQKKVALEKKEKEAKAAERKARATEVEDARKAMVEAQSKYREALESFCQQYGTYHQSLTGEDAKKAIPSLFDIFNPFIFPI